MDQTASPSPAQADGNGSVYPPLPGDGALVRGQFFIDSATLKPDPSNPGLTELDAEGSLPTPCNDPRVVVHPPDAQNRIVVEAYSFTQKDKVCTQVIQSFSGKIAILGGYPPGRYKVMVNNISAGELTVP